jgi:hypothetical protein
MRAGTLGAQFISAGSLSSGSAGCRILRHIRVPLLLRPHPAFAAPFPNLIAAATESRAFSLPCAEAYDRAQYRALTPQAADSYVRVPPLVHHSTTRPSRQPSCPPASPRLSLSRSRSNSPTFPDIAASIAMQVRVHASQRCVDADLVTDYEGGAGDECDYTREASFLRAFWRPRVSGR